MSNLSVSVESDFELLENEIIPIYKVTSTGEKVVDGRELHQFLGVETRFRTWVKRRVDNYNLKEGLDFSTYLSESNGGRPSREYIFTLDAGKELGMVEKNEEGKRIRDYFIEIEKRARTGSYQSEKPNSIEDLIIMQAQSVKELKEQVAATSEKVEKLVERTSTTVNQEDVTASDIARHLNLKTAKGFAHNGLVGAIARKLGFRTGLKCEYMDDNIKIIPDEEGNGYRCYYRPEGVNKITNWFKRNEDKLHYEDFYSRGGKYGDEGDLKEAGYKVEGIKYKTYLAKHK